MTPPVFRDGDSAKRVADEAAAGDRPVSAPWDDHDRLLDALLDEALGGQQPPDLSARIVQALASGAIGKTPAAVTPTRSASKDAADPRPIPIGRPIAVSLPQAVSPAGSDTMAWGKIDLQQAALLKGHLGPRSMSARHWLSLAATVLALGIGYWTLRPTGRNTVDPSGRVKDRLVKNRQSGGEIAKRPKPVSPAPQANADRLPDRPGANRDGAKKTGPSALAQDNSTDTPLVVHESDGAGAKPGVPTGITTHGGSLAGPSSEGPSSENNAVAEAAAQAPSVVTDKQAIAYIDGKIRERWREEGVRPSPAATDAEWCRRVFLDLIGRIPAVDELEAFLVDQQTGDDKRGGAKRARLVDRLLFDDRYVEAYARHWTTTWTHLLIGRSGGMLPGSTVNREGLQQYLRRSFLKNKPYDQMVQELISARGSNTPGDDDYNGAVNFVLDNLQEKAATATAKTAQIFLGLQIQCTQCHNHPFNEWKQNRFWELNAFFRQVAVAPGAGPAAQNGPRWVRLIDKDFVGEGAAAGAAPDPAEAEIYYELRNGEMRVAYPVFVDGTPIDPNGLVTVVNRRDELARLVVHSEYLGRAIVNRLWGHFFGYGFTKPVDDLGTHNAPSHPELLEKLGREFALSGHDLRRLMRWVTLSEAYSLSSRFGPKQGNQSDDPTLGVPPLFSHFYLRQMTAEQLYDSLLVATEAHRAQGNYEEQQRTKDEWASQFTIAFGTDDNGETTTFDGTITQTLMMMNGELTRQATSGLPGGFLSKVALAAPRSRQGQARQGQARQGQSRQGSRQGPINDLYRAALGRKPSKDELKLANELLSSRDGNAVTVLEDVWWALLNSNEFILNH